jgi:hypothetical protein
MSDRASSPPMCLTDSQLAELMRLAQPLAPPCRDAFLRILAHEFRGRRDIGDGELHRTAIEVIKRNRLFDPLLGTIEDGCAA